MKPLLDIKVQRLDTGLRVNEWQGAETHLTHDGQVAFHARMQARIKAAQGKPAANVQQLKTRKENR